MLNPYKRLVVDLNQAKSDKAPDKELRVIGAGLCRTSTSSLQAALVILGYGPCHHMATLFELPERSLMFYGALTGKPTDYRALMAGYQSTCDNPGCDLVPELMEAFPNAKVVLGLRDSPQVWWKSCSTTVYRMTELPYRISVFPIRFLRLQTFVIMEIISNWEKKYGARRGPEVYERHNEYIRSIVRKEKLLEFNAKEGWGPLCAFLGVPVPDVPFPRTNDTEMINKNIRMGMVMGQAAWAAMFAVVGLAVYWGRKREVWGWASQLAKGIWGHIV